MADFSARALINFVADTSGFQLAVQGQRPVGASFSGGTKYTDNEFPAASESVWTKSPQFDSKGKRTQPQDGGGDDDDDDNDDDDDDDDDNDEDEERDDPEIIFQRPEQFFAGRSYQLFEGEIEPNDINQGSLGNCWFLCSIASLAEFPELIVALFQPDSREVKSNGAYNILLCESGVWQNFCVDDLFPCDPESGSPKFATGNKNELWVQLLEKGIPHLAPTFMI